VIATEPEHRLAESRGDVPLTELRFRCSMCGTDRIDFVVTTRSRGEARNGL